jgi:hypothetical protein
LSWLWLKRTASQVSWLVSSRRARVLGTRNAHVRLRLRGLRPQGIDEGVALHGVARLVVVSQLVLPSLATSGETLTIEESMNLEGENGERHDVAGDREWSRAGG